MVSHSESKGQKALYTLKYQYFVGRYIAYHPHVFLLSPLLLGHHLTAGPAGQGTCKLTQWIEGHNGDGVNTSVGMLRRGSEKGRSLGA